MNTSGGGAVMGSFPHPRNGILKIDYEFILIFKKLGVTPKVTKEQKTASAMSTPEWNQYFSGHWNFGGEKQCGGHIAMFPLELPKRLIKMFSFVGEVVLDPFAGSGTTIRAAAELNRRGIGYEINAGFAPAIRKRLGISENGLFESDVEFITAQPSRSTPVVLPSNEITNNLQRKVNPKEYRFGSIMDTTDVEKPKQKGLRVREILSSSRLRVEDGGEIQLLGITSLPDNEKAALSYLNNMVLNKPIFLKFSGEKYASDGALQAYVYLENKTFINAKMIKQGLAKVDESEHHYAQRFRNYSSEIKNI